MKKQAENENFIATKQNTRMWHISLQYGGMLVGYYDCKQDLFSAANGYKFSQHELQQLDSLISDIDAA